MLSWSPMAVCLPTPPMRCGRFVRKIKATTCTYYYNSVAVFIQARANHGLPVCLSLIPWLLLIKILKLLFGLEFGTEVQIQKLILNQQPVQYKSGAEVFDFWLHTAKTKLSFSYTNVIHNSRPRNPTCEILKVKLSHETEKWAEIKKSRATC